MIDKKEVAAWFRELQARIIKSLESFEAKSRFESHVWSRPGGGGGYSRILRSGEIFEKAGVNVSEVFGELPEVMREKLGSKQTDFYATGLSLVIHPKEAHIPTVHANWRYFEQSDRAWFGGGSDLTPYVYQAEDFKHFHEALRKPCDEWKADLYPQWKKHCDEYFYIPHRKEHRGIGGIFFDYLSDDLARTFEFVKGSGLSFIEAYCPIVERRRSLKSDEREKQFQLLRRGRYVEFNLIYDRGTKFGLETKGNIESILMSLPPEVHFDFEPNLEATESEKKLMQVLRQPVDWI
jgi:coproporphyrinogen III oxidase